MRKAIRYFFGTSVLILVFVMGGVGGIILDRQVLMQISPPSFIPADAVPDFRLIAQAWNLIERSYVDRSAVTPQNLTYGAISGMVDALGDTGHSRFMSPSMVKEEQNATQGQFDGVGLEVSAQNGAVVIVAPIDGSPAKQAGLHAGEIITKVDSSDISGLSLSEVVSKIVGPAGTQVTLTIYDPITGQTQDVRLTRAHIIVNNVTWTRLPGTNIYDIRIATFSQGVDKSLVKALKDIQAQHPAAIILDLRNDPGGLLDQAVAVASQFKASGNVMEERDSQGKITPLPVQRGGLATQIPMAVLINRGSASAAEIVAGALQDGQRAILEGETTFGTGTVLNEFNLADGSAVLLATQEWLTPTGSSYWHKGIAPDVQVTLPANTIPLVPDQIETMTASQLKSSQDLQLLKAIDLLTQPSATGD